MIARGLVACALLVGVLGIPSKTWEERIVGGNKCMEGEYPHLISLKVYGGHSCGASILDKRTILTASHCVDGLEAEDLKVQYGVLDNTLSSNRIDVTEIRMHKGYKPSGNYPNDIALLKLAADIPLDGSYIKAIKLPEKDIGEGSNDMEYAELAGWGYTDSNHPSVEQFCLRTFLELWNHKNCERLLGDSYDRTKHVCAGSLDGSHKQCSGDSGGPLTIYDNDSGEHIQYGVVSWSYKPCSIRDLPGLFAGVFNYLDWIEENRH